MGHLINPLSYRLYNIRYWNNNWFLHNKNNYAYLSIQDILIFNFVKKFLTKYIKITRLGILFNNLKIIRNFNDFYLYLYIHDSFLDMLISKLKKNKKFFKLHKKLYYKNRKKYTFILEKQMLNKLQKKNINKKLLLHKISKLKRNIYLKKFLLIFIKQKILKNFWFYIKNILLLNLKKFNIFLNFNIFILNLSKNNVNSNIINEYIIIRLKQYYTIFEILKSINYFLKYLLFKKKIIKGYKITCAGRFSRKQRATYSWKSFGTLSLSTMKSKLDYNYNTIALKYSSCAIKVWICLHKKNKFLFNFII